MKKAIIVEIISFLFILLFGYAAGTKLIDYKKFAAQIGQSPLLTNFAEWVAWIIPSVELIIVVLLIVPRSRIIALYASFALMVVFTAYIIVILNFSSHIPCGCGGVLASLGWEQHLIFNFAFVFMALVGIFILKKIETEKKLIHA